MNEKKTSQCPCQSQHPFSKCCQPYLSNQQKPATPEALMRSRYTAYAQANIPYIQATMTGPALVNFDPEEAKTWATSVHWLGLKVLTATHNDTHGQVSFEAIYEQHGHLHTLKEVSEFEKVQGDWMYLTGQVQSD